MITNKVLKKQPEHKHVQGVQSWYEPALSTLEGLLEIRRANLRRINNDESKAAVMRSEFIEMLMTEHRISAWYAGEIIASLLRSERIMMLGRFIQIIEKAGEE